MIWNAVIYIYVYILSYICILGSIFNRFMNLYAHIAYYMADVYIYQQTIITYQYLGTCFYLIFLVKSSWLYPSLIITLHTIILPIGYVKFLIILYKSYNTLECKRTCRIY